MHTNFYIFQQEIYAVVFSCGIDSM